MPKKIANYTIVEILGRGGMGIVSKAVDEITGQQVALKVLHTPQVGLFSLLREINAIKRLDHPGVVKLLDTGFEKGSIWYAMEYLDAAPLQGLLYPQSSVEYDPQSVISADHTKTIDLLSVHQTAQKLSQIQTRLYGAGTTKRTEQSRYSQKSFDQEIADFLQPKPVFGPETLVLLGHAAQIANTLCYLHGQGLVHCDLKPDNVLVTSSGQAILIDFGLVTTQGSKTESVELSEAGMVVGTALYMAPEKIRGTRFDARVDLYALGCIMYQMIVGQPGIFHPETERILGHGQLCQSSRPSDFVSGVPPELDDLVVSLLSREPKNRPGYAQRVLHVLKDIGAIDLYEKKVPPTKGYLYRAPYIGRQKNMHVLQEKLKTCVKSTGSSVLILGESGIGKSSMASQLLQHARKMNFVCLTGKGTSPQKGEDPSGEIELSLFSDIFRHIADMVFLKKSNAFSDFFTPNAKVLLPFFPFLQQLSGFENCPEVHGVSRSDDQQRLLDEIVLTIEKAAKKRPLLMVFDDIQWADPLSLKVLDLLMNRTSVNPWSILVLGRSDLMIDSKLQQKQDLEVIHLKTLAPKFHESLIQEMLGGDKFPPELLTYVQNQTKGNPFYIRLCIQSALDTGYLRLTNSGEWSFELRIDDLLLASAPQDLTDVFEEAIQRLTEQQRALCNTLAVFGRATDVVTIKKITQIDEATILDMVQQLAQQSILVEPDENDSSKLDFLHWGVGDLFTGTINPEELRTMHLRIATLIEAQDNTDQGRLARHYDAAGLPVKARELYLQAAESAVSSHSVDRANVLFDKAFSLFDDERQMHAIKIRYASRVLAPRGLIVRAISVLREVIAQTSDYDLYLMAEASKQLARILSQKKEFTEADILLNQCLDIFQQYDDTEGIGDCKMQFAIIHFENQRYEKGIVALRELMVFAKEHEHESIYKLASQNLAYAFLDVGKYEESLQTVIPLLEQASQEKNEVYVMKLTNFLSLVSLYKGNLQSALEYSQIAQEKAKKYGLRLFSLNILGNMGLIYMQLENYAECVSISQQVIRLAKDLGVLHVQFVAKLNILLCHLELAQYMKARSLIAKLESQTDKLDHYLHGYLLYAKARLERYKDNPESAIIPIVTGIEMFKRHKIIQPYAVLLCEYGHLQLALEYPMEEIERNFAHAEALKNQLNVKDNSELGIAVGRLARAIKAYQRGEVLIIGSVAADLPEMVNKSLRL